MDPPVAAEVEAKSEKTDETKHAKTYDCGLCDTEVVYKIAQELLPGLAETCVDTTTGGIFKTAGSVVVDMRKEMTDYLTQRSETYVAEFLLSENAANSELSEHPYDIILNLIDDFSSSKTNMFSRVSELVLTDRREDRIDDFVQEMEINGFWLLDRREYVASTLLKNVDYKNLFHCNMVCNSEEELAKHRAECKFRPMDCTNEGCTTTHCAAQKEHHEAVCPFMILPCEQQCSDAVMRREMDRHCVTVCPTKLVHCAFYTVGCESCIPRCNVQQHNIDDLDSHLLYIIKTAYKEASDEDLKQRVNQIKSLSNTEKLARARDTRALTYLIKDAEAKLGPLDVKTEPHAESAGREDSNNKDSTTKTEPSVVNPPKKQEENQGLQSARSSTDKPVITEDDTKLNTNQVPTESPTKTELPAVKDGADPPTKKVENPGSQPARSSAEKPVITADDTKSPTKQVHTESPTKTEPSIDKDRVDPPKKKEESPGSQSARSSTEKPVITEDETKLPTKQVHTESPTKTEPSVVKDGADPPKKKEENPGSQSARSSTEKTVTTEDDIKLPTEQVSQVHTESPASAGSPVKLEENKDKDEPFSSPVKLEEIKDKDESFSSPVKLEEIKDKDESFSSPVKLEDNIDIHDSFSSPVKLEDNIDLHESFSSPTGEEHEHIESPVKDEVFKDLHDEDGNELATIEQSTKVKEDMSNTVSEKTE